MNFVTPSFQITIWLWYPLASEPEYIPRIFTMSPKPPLLIDQSFLSQGHVFVISAFNSFKMKCD